MAIEEIKRAIWEAIDSKSDRIIEIAEKIFLNPELGFKEYKTADLVASVFTELGIEFEKEIALTGLKGVLKGNDAGIRIAVVGELDAVVSPLHPMADLNTGAAHSCGHHSQIAAMLGVAYGLVLSGAMKDFSGDVLFIAVPAEEYVELEYRQRLIADGKIVFFGGKQEMIRLGVFEDVDMGMMVHSHAHLEDRKLLTMCDSSGFIGKVIKYTGREAHAGAAPHEGVNALNAAMLGIMGIHAQRETFRESDRIRIHPVITKGGDMVNIIPADVRLETYVRGRTMESVKDAAAKTDRALRAGADAVGADVVIQDIPGYLPLIQNEELNRLIEINGILLEGRDAVLKGYELMGSTDAGDLSSVMPFVHFSSGGYQGAAHSKDFKVVDPYAAYILPAKAMAGAVADLLFNKASEGKKILEQSPPRLSRKEYLGLWNS